MAVNDVIVDLDDIAATSTVDFQPALGVEILITGGSSEATGAGECRINQTDGTLSAFLVDLFVVSTTRGWIIKFFINNTVFLQRQNTTGGALAVGYFGVQTNA